MLVTIPKAGRMILLNVMNAILDALYRAYRIRHVDMPATPERIWGAIREGKRLHTL